MRIAYIAPYQGPGLLERRPILRNLALAGNVKIELVAELLQRRGHEVEVLSQGEVVENRLKHYGAFAETRNSESEVGVHYASALPVRFLNGWWSSHQTLALFRERHDVARFDLVIIYNLKPPQVTCASYAMGRLGLPVVVEYEDDAFVDVGGQSEQGRLTRLRLRRAQRVLDSASGCIGVSPFLLSRFPPTIPRILLRGVIGDDFLDEATRTCQERKNQVVFSGTLFRSKGLEPLIKAWGIAKLPHWQLHIAGHGELADRLRHMAKGDSSIVFHGLLNRQQNARLLRSAKVGINPHEISATPGNVFAFKIIEYLAAGAHVISTPMGELETDLERGITYLADNEPETIAAALRRVVDERLFDRTATQAALDAYGPETVASSLDRLLRDVIVARQGRRLDQPTCRPNPSSIGSTDGHHPTMTDKG